MFRHIPAAGGVWYTRIDTTNPALDTDGFLPDSQKAGTTIMTIPCPRVLVLAALCACLAVPALAQPQSILDGVVQDAVGRVIVDALVSVETEAGSWETTLQTDQYGYFVASHLAPGRYRVRASAQGFQPYIDIVTVSRSGTPPLSITLHVRLTEHISVHPLAPRPRPDSVVGAILYRRPDLDRMFLTNGGTLQSVECITPGIQCIEQSGSPGQSTALGQRRDGNYLTIDGVSANLWTDPSPSRATQTINDAMPGWGQDGSTKALVPFAAIDEITVQTWNTTQEPRRSPGAQTRIVTRAGGNQAAGLFATDVRVDELSAHDWFDNANGRDQPVQFWNAGASVGGPLRAGRVYHFTAWEGQGVSRPADMSLIVPSRATREQASGVAREILDAWPLPNGPDQADGLAEFRTAFPIDSSLQALSVRVDANLSSRHRAFVRVNGGHSEGDETDGQMGTPRLTAAYRGAATTATVTGGVNSELSATIMNELRINTSLHRSSIQSSTPPYGNAAPLPVSRLIAPNVALSDAWVGINLFGGTDGTMTRGVDGAASQEQFYVANTTTLLHGRHTWRVGVDARQGIVGTNPAPYRYTYRFLGLQGLLQGTLQRMLVDHLPPTQARFRSASLFVQDTFDLSARTSFTFGLRYKVSPAPTNLANMRWQTAEYERLPALSRRPADAPFWRTSWTDVAPQVAATYLLSATPNRETTLQAGWSSTPDDLTSVAAIAGGARSNVAVRDTTNAIFPAGRELLFISPPSDRQTRDIVALPATLRSPRTDQWHVGIDQALGPLQRVSASFVRTSGRDLVYWSRHPLVNAAPTIQADAYTNDGRSEYTAAILEYTRRLSGSWSGRVAHTWSRAKNNRPEEQTFGYPGFAPPPTLISPDANWGTADHDRPHALYASVSYLMPPVGGPTLLRHLGSDWTIDLVAHARSGAPATVTWARRLGGYEYWMRLDEALGVPTWISDANAPGGRKVNPAAFVNITEPREGTHARNSLRSFPLRQIDLAVSRPIRFGPRVSAMLRAEIYNVFNILNFGPLSVYNPFNTELEPAFGEPYVSYSRALGTGTFTGGGPLPVRQVGGPRSIHAVLRFQF